MNQTRIVELRQVQGWTQERLASASGVGLRTVQRLEAGQDASLETLTLIAEALQVPVRELFTSIDNAALSSRVESMQDRADEQQAARDRISGAWRWLYIGVGVIMTMLSFTFAHGLVLFLSYWVGGLFILIAVRRLYLEPHLDEKYPLSRRKESRHKESRRNQRSKLRDAAAASANDAKFNAHTDTRAKNAPAETIPSAPAETSVEPVR